MNEEILVTSCRANKPISLSLILVSNLQIFKNVQEYVHPILFCFCNQGYRKEKDYILN
jgi:hypothetical protein